MTKIPFTVTARTAQLIGQENFANAEGAVIELVKNAYDADALECLIVFTHEALYLIDNGVGMTEAILKDSWMKIGTNNKLLNYESKLGRVKTGAKGIGRFALDKLGKKALLLTKTKGNKNILKWSLDWEQFNKPGIVIGKVMADLDTVTNLTMKSHFLEEFKENEVALNRLSEIDFIQGTTIKIENVKDEWNYEDIHNLFNSLEILIPPTEQSDFKVSLISSEHPDDFGEVNSAYYDDYDYKITASYLGDEDKTVNYELFRNELDANKINKDYTEVFNQKAIINAGITSESLAKNSESYSVSLKNLAIYKSEKDKSLFDQIGQFYFTFYFLKKSINSNDQKIYPYKRIVQADRKSWLEKFGGIKIFRDDFRVRPYGEAGNDWLKLGLRAQGSPGGAGQKLGGYKVRSDQLAGTVSISRVANSIFQDKSGREGIQENSAFRLFKSILHEMIAEFERDRNVIMYSFSELAKIRFKDEEDKLKAKSEAERILQDETDSAKPGAQHDLVSGNTGSSSESERLLARANKVYEQEIEEKDEEIRSLRGLASVGLIVSSFAHELRSLRTRLGPRTRFLKAELENHLDLESLSELNEQDNPIYMVKLIEDEDFKLKHWLEYSLSTLKRDKRKRQDIDLAEYFKQFKASWSIALKQRKVGIKLNGTRSSSSTLRAFEIDLDAIFNNLLSNSLTALKKVKDEKYISIEWGVKGKFLVIKFSDNGIGLADEYKSNPNRIFDFNESTKRNIKGDQIGTGIGLYIVQLAIDDYEGAQVSIVPSEIGLEFELKFLIRKS